MGNIITHNANLSGRPVQTYATDASTVALDLNGSLSDDGQPYYELGLLEALALSRLLEAAIRDAQQGTFSAPPPQAD